MSIEPGRKLLHYELVEQIGAGGMGVVWKALDPTLERDVAIKILPESLVSHPERVARFEREAKVLASLDHANIASVYGLHREGDIWFIAMEYVPGDDLATLIGKNAPAVETSLGIALQIAEALEAAHDQGVIHRDLKPANIRVMPDGKVKVLDFGLAKALAPQAAEESANLANSPTLTSTGTLAGTILGTAAYMSPEQASGVAVDRRTDIWAFGVVLLEMLSGRAVFAGDTVSHVLASVLKDEPDLSPLATETPEAVRRLLRACLRKKPRRRLQSIGDARVVLEDVLEGREPAVTGAAAPTPRGRRWLLGAVVGALLVAAGFIGRSWMTPAVGPPPLSRLSVTLPEEVLFESVSYPGRSIDISPDGSMIVFRTPDGLRIRRLDELESRLLPDTAGGGQPTFSPDGRWVAFLDSEGLKKIPTDGGRPIVILPDLPNGSWLQMDWARDGRIVFDTWNAGLRRVSSEGGEAEVLTDPENEWHLDPRILPDGETVLYFVQSGSGEFRVEAIPIDGGDTIDVVDNASHPRYIGSGHLLFMRDGLLMVAPFDDSRVETTGPAVVVPIDVMVDHINVAAPLPQLAVSDQGTLVYVPDRDAGAESATLARIDRGGAILDTFEVPLRHPHFSIAPDGKRLAVSGRSGADALTYILDVERKTLTRLLSEKTDYAAMALWAPDGSGLYFARYGTHECELWFQPIEGGSPRRLVSHEGTWSSPVSVSADGRYVAYFAYHTESSGDIWYLDLRAGNEEPEPQRYILDTSALWPSISPDGKWLAYQSWGEAYGGYVRRFPEGSLAQRISVDNSDEALWSPDGRELFYRTQAETGLSSIKVVSVNTDPALTLGEPRTLFKGLFQESSDSGLSIAVWPDGDSLLLVPKERLPNKSSEIVVVQNWFQDIEAIAPAP